MIREHLPPKADDTLMLLCGPPPMVKFAGIANLEKVSVHERRRPRPHCVALQIGFTESEYFAF